MKAFSLNDEPRKVCQQLASYDVWPSWLAASFNMSTSLKTHLYTT